MQTNPSFVLVSPLNRLGQNPNVNRIHYGILGSFKKHSFDRSMPSIGVCVEAQSEEGIRKLLAHNNRLLPA